MKAQVLYDVADLRYEEVSKPQLKKGWVLVKVKAAGVCGSDIPRIYKTGAHVHPLIPGHEFSGQVVNIYDESSAEWQGKRVGIFPLIPCGKCAPCHKKQYEMCKDYNYLGSRCDGGFAEYVAVPEWNLIELPDNVTYEQAAMMEPMSVAVHAIRQFDGLIRNGQKADNTDDYIKDKSVCIIGLGTIGLLLTMFLIDAGIKNIYVICNKMAQKEQALELGIPEDNIVVEAEKEKNIADKSAISMGLKEYDYVFECVGRQETVCRAIELAAPAAHIVVVGNPYSDMSFPKDIYWKLLRYQLKLGGTWNSSYTKSDSDDWHYVLGRLKAGSIHPEKLITHRYSLEDIYKGMEIMRDKTEDYVKVMLYEF